MTSTRTSSIFKRSSVLSDLGSSERGNTCRHESQIHAKGVGVLTRAATVLVCKRPLASVAGTRCTRCTPLSQRNVSYAPEPFTSRMTSLNPPLSLSELANTVGSQPFSRAKRPYILESSAANREDSEPPTPALSSTRAESPSVSEDGRRAFGRSCTRSERRSLRRPSVSTVARSRSSGESKSCTESSYVCCSG